MAGALGYAHLTFGISLDHIKEIPSLTCGCADKFDALLAGNISSPLFSSHGITLAADCLAMHEASHELLQLFLHKQHLAMQTTPDVRFAHARDSRQVILAAAAIAGIAGAIFGAASGATATLVVTNHMSEKQDAIIENLQLHDDALARSLHDQTMANITLQLLANHTAEIERETHLANLAGVCLREATAARSHLIRIEAALYHLATGRLHPSLVKISTLELGFKGLFTKVSKKGYSLVNPTSTDLYRRELSFATNKDGVIIVILHAPIYLKHSLLPFFKYVPTPIWLSNTTYAMIDPPRRFLAISNSTNNYMELSSEDLLHCSKEGATYYCNNNNIIKTGLAAQCLSSIFSQRSLLDISDRCKQYTDFFHGLDDEFAAQVGPHEFLLYFTGKAHLSVECRDDRYIPLSRLLTGAYHLRLPITCRARTTKLILSPESSLFSNMPNVTISVPLNVTLDDWFAAISNDTAYSIIRDILTIPDTPYKFHDIRKRINDISFRWGFDIPIVTFGVSMATALSVLTIALIWMICSFCKWRDFICCERWKRPRHYAAPLDQAGIEMTPAANPASIP